MSSSNSVAEAEKSNNVEDLQRYITTLQSDVTKLQIQLFKSEETVKKLQELNAIYCKGKNNTSSAFALPSEFKQAWEEMVNDVFVDAFCDFLEDPTELVHLVKDTFQAVYSTLLSTREARIKSVASTLNLPESTHDQLATRYLAPLFQEFSLSVFSFSEDYYKQICSQIRTLIQTREETPALETWLESTDLKRFLEALHKLYLHMVLNDPPIELKLNREKVEYKEFSKSSFHCLDGFPKDGAACIVVIPAPMRQGHVYQGIKGSVVIIKSPSKEIIEAIAAEKEKAKENKVVNVQPEKEDNKKADVVEDTAVNKDIKPVPEPEQKTEVPSKPHEPEPETVIHESVKPKTTRPVSIKYEAVHPKTSWPSRSKCTSNKRNHSLQIEDSNGANHVENKSAAQGKVLVTEGSEDSASEKPKVVSGRHSISHRQPSPLQSSARRTPVPISRASTARGIRLMHAEEPKEELTEEFKDEIVKTTVSDMDGLEVNKNNSKSVNKTFHPEGWGWLKGQKGVRTPAKICDESYDTKAKELRKKLIQMGKQCRLQRSGRGTEEESSEQREIDQSTPNIASRSYKTAKDEELKKSIGKLRPFAKMELEKNSNMPLQPAKILTQQEKLLAYQRILKAKMSSIKSSATDTSEFVKHNKHACESKALPKDSKTETDPVTNHYDSIKTSFHSKIQELNAKLFKYKKCIKSYEAEQHKAHGQTFAKRPQKEPPLNGSVINCHSPGGALNSAKKTDSEYMSNFKQMMAGRIGMHNKENTESKREGTQNSNRGFSFTYSKR